MPLSNDSRTSNLTCGVGLCQVELGQPEVAKLNVSFGIIEDIVRLEVPMDDSLRMDVSQACQRLSYDLHPTRHSFLG